MTVGELQRYFHGLADAVAHAPLAESVVRELRAAADGLGPFATLDLPAFTEFLKRAWTFELTGQVPGPARTEPRPFGKARRSEVIFVPTLEGLRSLLGQLADPTATPHATEEQVRRELERFRRLKDDEWAAAAAAAGMIGAPTLRHQAIRELARFLMAKRAAAGEVRQEPAGGQDQPPDSGPDSP